MTRADYFFLALIVFGLVVGLGYVLAGHGPYNALLYSAVVLVASGVIGGLRR